MHQDEIDLVMLVKSFRINSFNYSVESEFQYHLGSRRCM